MIGRVHRLAWALTMTVGVACCVAAGAIALPAGRHYEMVSPVFKGGFGASGIRAVAENGESVAFYSPGAFAGAPGGIDGLDYIARRTTAGWSTAPIMAPAQLIASWEAKDVSPSLGTVFELGLPGTSYEGGLHSERLLLHPTGLPDVVSGWEQLAALEGLSGEEIALNEEGADPSFCHLLLKLPGAGRLLSEAEGTTGQLYELNRGCNGERSSLTLIGVNNGQPQPQVISSSCAVDLGAQDYASNGVDTFNAVSRDGSEVFFTDCISGPTKVGSPHQLFVRLAGERTVEVSKPVEEACGEVPCPKAKAVERASAEFAGASESGTRVYFTAPLSQAGSPLVPGDEDASNNLYMATIGCPAANPGCSPAQREVTELTDVSHDPNGGAAEVQGVVRVAPDGERAYFVAGGDLLSGAQRKALEAAGRPVPSVGADNLYAYDGVSAPGTIAFVGDVCSGPELSGSTQDSGCPNPNVNGSDVTLWHAVAGAGHEGESSHAQTAGADGRYLLFATHAQLTADDTDNAEDVYRYDAQTGSLTRISGGEGGYDANGNCNDGTEPPHYNSKGELVAGDERVCDATIVPGNRGLGGEGDPVRSQHEMNTRAISEDGSRIVFLSPERLSPLVSNGLANAYEWHEGAGVSLVDAGSGEQPLEDVVVSPDGANVFFVTPEGLAPQDADGLPDVYDARLGGEQTSSSPAAERQCEGDGCQGPLTNPAPLLVPGSVTQAPGGNLPPPAKPKKSPPKCRRGYKRGAHGRCVKAKKARKTRKGASARRRRGRSNKGGKS